jgi:aspartate ammonia-lyase
MATEPIVSIPITHPSIERRLEASVQQQAPEVPTRTETDSLGSVEVPADAYWGVHTMRALENFPISKRPISVYPDLVVALAQVKQAASRANREVGVLDAQKQAWIDEACQRIIDGELHDQFVVGVIQGGAGTSTNMNANEVIANLALEIGGYEKARYDVIHPIDDVNRSQSTNDTYPTAIKLAMTSSLTTMLAELDLLRISFGRKGREFHDVLKVGRTQLQDAVPMTLGQEFHGFATTLGEDIARLRETIKLLSEVNLGATAIGTGITADPGYAAAAIRHLNEITGLRLEAAPDLIEATSDTGVFMTFSSALKRSAIKLSKICNDLRLLSSGPQAGFGEINLPPRQAGSSIMPGKVNPVIPEAVSQVAYAVAGAAAAERVRAGDRAFAAAVHHLDASGVLDAAGELCRRHHRERRASRRDGRVERGRHHRAHPVHRLCRGVKAREGRTADRPTRRGPRRRVGDDDPGRRRTTAAARPALRHGAHHAGDPGDRTRGRAERVAGPRRPQSRGPRRARSWPRSPRQWVRLPGSGS